MSEPEQPLLGGNASDFVLRVGDTVRKPWRDSSASVQSYLQTLFDAGVRVPRPLGMDDQGRQSLEYIHGDFALGRHFDPDELHRVGGMVRAVHDASPEKRDVGASTWDILMPVAGADLICHNDLAPWNLVIGAEWVFFDWDGSGPSTRVADLGYAARAFVGMADGGDPAADAIRLRAFVDGYGADESIRQELADAIVERTQSMYSVLVDAKRTGREPWATLHDEGQGDYWGLASVYVADNLDTWKTALRA